MKILTLMLIVILISCTKNDDTEKIKFGVIAPLSGMYGDSGDYIKDGVNKALKKINNKNLEIFYEDACKGKESINSYKKLTNLNKIDAINANYCVIGLSALNPYLKKDKLITFQTSVISNSFLENNDNIFSSFTTAKKEMDLLSNLIISENKKNIAIIKLETPWGEEYLKYFNESIKDKNIKIVNVQEVSITENDFRANILNIKKFKPDSILIIHFGNAIRIILDQLEYLKINKYGVQEAYSNKIYKNLNGNNNFKFILPWKHNKNQNPLTMHTYNNTIDLYKAFIKCRKNKECIKKELKINLKKENNNDYTIVSLGEGKFNIKYGVLR